MRPNFLVGLGTKAVKEETERVAAAAASASGAPAGTPASTTPAAATPTPTSAAPVQETEEQKKEAELFNSLFEKKYPGKKLGDLDGLFSRKPFETEAQEKFGRPVEEVDTFLKNPPPAVPKLKTPLLQQHFDFVEAGGTEEQWEEKLALKKSLGKMSHEDLVMFDLQRENPTLEADDLQSLFNNMYKIPKELDPEKFYAEEVADRLEEIKQAKVRIKVQGEKIRVAETAKAVEALKTPVSNRRELTAEEREAGIQVKKSVFDKFAATKGVSIEVVEGEKGKETRSNLSFDLRPEQRQVAEQILNSPTGFFDACTKDGKLDPEKFVMAATLVAGGIEAVETIAVDLANAKLAAFIKGLKNANFENPEGGSPIPDAMQTILQKATKQVFSRR